MRFIRSTDFACIWWTLLVTHKRWNFTMSWTYFYNHYNYFKTLSTSTYNLHSIANIELSLPSIPMTTFLPFELSVNFSAIVFLIQNIEFYTYKFFNAPFNKICKLTCSSNVTCRDYEKFLINQRGIDW